MKRVNLKSESDGVGKKFIIIALTITLSLNSIVFIAWYLWSRNHGNNFFS